MSRLQKTTVEWFPHPVTHGRKMGALERKYGNDGYSVWFKILEELGSAALHTIALRDEVQIELYAARCLVEPVLFMQIVGDLLRWEEFDQSLWETRRVLYSKKFIQSVSEVYRKRKTPPPAVADVLNQFPALPQIEAAAPSGGGSPAAHPVHAQTGEPAAEQMPAITSYEDINRHPPMMVAQAITGETEQSNKRAVNTWKKYHRILSAEDPDRGNRMFRDVLEKLFGDIKAGEIKNPGASLTKRLKEIAE